MAANVHWSHDGKESPAWSVSVRQFRLSSDDLHRSYGKGTCDALEAALEAANAAFEIALAAADGFDGEAWTDLHGTELHFADHETLVERDRATAH